MPIGQNKPLVRALAGESITPPPWWLMRQAGRYLPEYRATRVKANDFVEMCLTPAIAAELTLQPVRRYRMDGAILFSDILMLPYALGQALTFREREGPILEPIENHAGIGRLKLGQIMSHLEPVFDAVRRVAEALDTRTTLIGFAGSPWTVATYMVEGRTSREFRQVKSWAYRDAKGFGALIDLLVEGTVDFLAAQMAAGAEVVQLFDSWAGILPEPAFGRWVIEPTRRIVAALKRRFPDHPIIGFPRGAGLLYERYITETGIDGVGLDTMVPAGYARAQLQQLATIQGNLDPVLLIAGGAALETAVKELCRMLGGGPFVFNLGHGVLPETPPENVETLATLLAGSNAA
ncbi:MAG: uroporphyrinogen decarboxylase [Alphaproteobacteria bacterium]|nr:uroporphyrinogen decarboxylase [Alphaproteobacteria bacterium]